MVKEEFLKIEFSVACRSNTYLVFVYTAVAFANLALNTYCQLVSQRRQLTAACVSISQKTKEHHTDATSFLSV